MIRNEKRETRWMTFFVPLYVPFLLVLFFDERHFPSLSLSLCLSLFDSVENERWRILGSTEVEYFRRYLNSASKGGRRKERMRRTRRAKPKRTGHERCFPDFDPS